MTAPSAGSRDTSSFLERFTRIVELDCYAHFGLDSHGNPQLLSSSCLPEEPALATELLRRLEERGAEGGLELRGERELPEALGRAGFRALALRPLRVNGALRGFLIFCSKGDYPFDDRVMRLLELVSEELERRRIAELVHGDLQQILAGAKVHVDMAVRRAGASDAYLMERLQTAAALLNDVLVRTRSISQELSPAVVRRSGLRAALETLVSEMGRIYGLTAEIAVAGEMPPLEERARMIIYRAVQELLLNVAKHAEINTARVEIQAEAGVFELTVQDGGKGFDVDQTLTDPNRSGLGLVTIRDRIEAIGGQFTIDSAPGAGSTFAISLETSGVEERSEAAQESAEREVDATPGKGKRSSPSRVTRVLIVDDHAVIRQGLAVLIDEEEDLEVVGEADSGEKALEVARRVQPDVVVMDYTLGSGINGAEATRRVKGEFPEIKVVGLSMHGDEDTLRTMLEAGAEVHLPKEGPSQDVIAAIRRNT